jgi:hypothetical protein
MIYTKANMIKDTKKRIKALEAQAEKASGAEYHQVTVELLKADQYLETLKNTKE